jgi:type IV secretion system protein TrbL
MFPDRHLLALLPVLVALVLAAAAAAPSVAQADVCSDIPSVPLVPNPVKSGCEVVAHPKKSVEEAVEDVTHPGQAIGSAITAPIRAAGDEVMQGVTSWVADGASWLVEQAGKLIGQTTTPRIESSWFLEQYTAMGALAALFALPLLFLTVLQGVIRHDGGMILRAACWQLPLAFLLTAMAVTVVQLLLALTDQMSSQIAAPIGSDATTFLSSVAKALLTISAATGSPVPLFAVFLGALVAAVGAFFVWIELLIRADGIYIAVLFLPFTFVAMIWPHTARWCRRLVELLGAIIFSKFVIVAIMALAAAGLAHSGFSQAFEGVLAGAGLLLLAAFSPLALLRMIPLVEPAAHTSSRSGAGAQTLGPAAGPATVMRRVSDANWGALAGGGALRAAPAFAGAAGGVAATETMSNHVRARTGDIGGAAGGAASDEVASGASSGASSAGGSAAGGRPAPAPAAPTPQRPAGKGNAPIRDQSRPITGAADRQTAATPPPPSEPGVQRSPAGADPPLHQPPSASPAPPPSAPRTSPDENGGGSGGDHGGTG